MATAGAATWASAGEPGPTVNELTNRAARRRDHHQCAVGTGPSIRLIGQPRDLVVDGSSTLQLASCRERAPRIGAHLRRDTRAEVGTRRGRRSEFLSDQSLKGDPAVGVEMPKPEIWDISSYF